MRLSDLNEHVEFWQATATATARNGDRTGTEAMVFSCFANVKQLSGQQRLYAEQLQYGNPYTVTIRYRNTVTVTPDMKIIWRGKRLGISGPPNTTPGDWKWLSIAAYLDGQENIPNYRQEPLPEPEPGGSTLPMTLG